MMRTFLILLGLLAGADCEADVIGTVDVLRTGGCGGLIPAAPRLRHDTLLDHAAAAWAAGGSLAGALQRSGYTALVSSGLKFSGPDALVMQALRRSTCATVADPQFHDIGTFSRGGNSWAILGAARVAPPATDSPALVTRALELINAARARGARCGARSFAPAAPVTLSTTLADVALGHAADMAAHNYFEHQDLGGHTPADRVRATGYREKLVGENIAYGPVSVEEVVRGWLDSPAHCENIMDPRFSEMGLAYSKGRVVRHGLYWVQLLAAPRA